MKSTAPQSLAGRAVLLGAGALAGALRRREEAPGCPEPGPAEAPAAADVREAEPERSAWLRALRETSEKVQGVGLPPPRDRPARRRATGIAFVALFALGASLTAAAGDQVAELAEQTAAPPTAEVAAAAPAAAAEQFADDTGGEPIDPMYGEEPAGTPAPDPAAPTQAPEPGPAAPEPGTAAPEPASADEPPPPGPTPPTSAPAAAEDIVLAPPRGATAPAQRRAMTPLAAPRRTPPLVAPATDRSPARGLEVEAEDPGAATVWLDRALPNPTPPSRRLTAAFARQLTATARTQGVDWAVLLGLLRARGELGSTPATTQELTKLARSLSRAREATSRPLLAVAGDTATADTAGALAHLHRALGMPALVHGLEWAKRRLGDRLLRDRRVSIYAAGRTDIEAGRIDVRVLALIAYLAETYGGVNVSSLDSGHRLYSRPGVVSAHKYGLAADIATVGTTPVLGSQSPGGITEQAVRSILLLPAELRPRQVISLLGLGGPSFPMADHGDHIHVGF